MNSNVTAPDCCLQWYTDATGTIQSFNYQGGYHLANQDYAICIRMNQVYSLNFNHVTKY